MSVPGEQSCPDNHSSFRCAAANKACNAQTSASSCVTSGTRICDIVIRLAAKRFRSCCLTVSSGIPVRETVRESSESGASPAVRFPPPPPHLPCVLQGEAVSAEWVSRALPRRPCGLIEVSVSCQDIWSTIEAANDAGSETSTVSLRAKVGSVSQGAWFTKKRLNEDTIAVSA